jgi:hypothetical protein
MRSRARAASRLRSAPRASYCGGSPHSCRTSAHRARHLLQTAEVGHCDREFLLESRASFELLALRVDDDDRDDEHGEHDGCELPNEGRRTSVRQWERDRCAMISSAAVAAPRSARMRIPTCAACSR